MKTAIVIGGGVSGLAAAWRLKKSGANVLLIEKKKEVGGVMQGMERDGFNFDYCVSEMMLKSERMEHLIGEMGLAMKMIAANKNASKRYIVRHGHPVALPTSIFLAPFNPLLTPRGKWGLLKEWTVAKGMEEDETVAAFTRRRFGRDFLDYAMGPLVSGIYAGDPETLSMRHALPTFWQLEKDHGSLIGGMFAKMWLNMKSRTKSYNKRLISFDGGMRTIPRVLASQLEGCIVTGAAVTSIAGKEDGGWIVKWKKDGADFEEVSQKLVIAVPAYAVGELPLPEKLKTALSFLKDLPYSSVATVFTGYAKEAVPFPLDSFGVLIPRRETHGMIGTQFLSSMFPLRAPEGHAAMMSFVGGMYAPQYEALPDMEIKALVRSELARLLGVRGVPEFDCVYHWPKAIPHFPVGYQKTLDALDAAETAWPNLAIVGNYRGGPASGDSMLKASDAMDALLKR
jgi:protoporphyrinogen/coproporphyrinogen III oxidase